jgi:hypothetical protein
VRNLPEGAVSVSALGSAYWTDGFQERTCFTVRRCSHPDFRHACLLREDLAACTTLLGPLPPQPGLTYVASLDVGVVNDRTVLSRSCTPVPRHTALRFLRPSRIRAR